MKGFRMQKYLLFDFLYLSLIYYLLVKPENIFNDVNIFVLEDFYCYNQFLKYIYNYLNIKPMQ